MKAAAALVVLGAVVGMAGTSARGSETAAVSIVVDAAKGRHVISPLIYGWNGDATLNSPGSAGGGFSTVLTATRPGLIRVGGNRWTAYNWEKNYSNAGSDYLYENDDYLSSSTTPGAAVKATVEAAKTQNTTTLVTIPIQNYVSADKNGPVSHTGTVDTSRFKLNRPGGPLTTIPNTTDGYVYQNEFADWLVHAVPGAKVMYSLDNEPNDWYETHPEVHPKHLTYAELTNDHIRYATTIKNAYKALGLTPPLVTAPALDGWQGQEDPDSNDGSSADYQTYGRYVDYWLQHMKSADTTAGHRLVDVLDLHWYPQVMPGVYNNDASASVVAAREQAPRSLWDPNDKENSWIVNDVLLAPIKLIPRVRAEIAQYDPGIGLGISEWNYGGGEHISGGVTTADTLGIFGKYGLKMATYWPEFEPHEDWAFGAFEVFRNYDGHGASFGDTSISATDTDTAHTSVYASVDHANANRMVIVAVNKNTTATATTIKVSGLTTGHAAVYRLTSVSPHPKPAASITATSANTFSYTMPAQSVSVLVPGP